MQVEKVVGRGDALALKAAGPGPVTASPSASFPFQPLRDDTVGRGASVGSRRRS